jgi:hypothetical protein
LVILDFQPLFSQKVKNQPGKVPQKTGVPCRADENPMVFIPVVCRGKPFRLSAGTCCNATDSGDFFSFSGVLYSLSLSSGGA